MKTSRRHVSRYSDSALSRDQRILYQCDQGPVQPSKRPLVNCVNFILLPNWNGQILSPFTV